jgi:hypothetical protein
LDFAGFHWTFMQEISPDWAEYKRVERGHSAGIHKRCDPVRCTEAMRLCGKNESRLEALALLAALRRKARKTLGENYAATVAASKAELPDYLYLPKEPDLVHHISAKVRIKELT